MTRPLLQGSLIHLAAISPEKDAEVIAHWSENTEYWRLFASDPARPGLSKTVQHDLGKEELKNDAYRFAIRTLGDDRLVGRVDLDGIVWNNRDAWLSIGIGDPADWGKGYGSDALRAALRFAFSELNLFRVSLTVFEYNPRAIRAYEKVGFTCEGRLKCFLRREGRRWDLLYFGILREEWEKQPVE